MQTLWDQVERSWPARGGEPAAGYRVLRDRALELLGRCSIPTVGFSHFGVVVGRIEEALSAVAGFTGTALPEVTAAWVEAYQVQVARFPLEGTELELIAPRGESFFAEHQHAFGDGLHHLSVQVLDVSAALERLSAHGVRLIDREPRTGSHGKVAFSAPDVLAPVRLEVFQASGGH